MASRIIVRIELTPPAKKALNALTDKAGMTQVALLSRLVEWMARQSSVVQASVLDQSQPAGSAETGRLIIKQIASGKKG